MIDFSLYKNIHDLDLFENVLFPSRKQSWEILII